MKIDMRSEAITRRLRQVDDLREACLSLANSSAGRRIRQKHPDNPVVQRTTQAIGDNPTDRHATNLTRGNTVA